VVRSSNSWPLGRRHPAGTDDESFFIFLGSVITRAQVVRTGPASFPSGNPEKKMGPPRRVACPDLAKPGGDILLTSGMTRTPTRLSSRPRATSAYPCRTRPQTTPPLRDQNLFTAASRNWFGSSASAIWRQSCCCWPTPGTPNYGSVGFPPGSWGPGPADRLRPSPYCWAAVAVAAELLADEGKLRQYRCHG